MSTAIEVQKLTKSYGKNNVLKEISFKLCKGKIVSILGPNGAGKSTLIDILCTVRNSNGGDAFVNGLDLIHEKEQIKKAIAYTPQDVVVYDQLNATENLVFFAIMHGIPKKYATQRAQEILKKLGLGDRTDKVKNFSGGMKRRLNLGISAIMNPQILFLDEPTVGLDPDVRHLVWKFIRELKERGSSVILTTHDMNEADQLSDYVIIMNEGQIVQEGTPQDLKSKFSEQNVIELMMKETVDIEALNTIIKDLKELRFIKEVVKESEHRISIFSSANYIEFTTILNQNTILHLNDIESYNFRQGSLEDVFLRLTGRRLSE
jgi:ABC-2 type transport system ATP-binding protein